MRFDEFVNGARQPVKPEQFTDMERAIMEGGGSLLESAAAPRTSALRQVIAEDTEEKYNGMIMSIAEGEDGFKLTAKTPDGQKLGFVEFSFDTEGTIRAEELEVFEKYRGQGIGKAMYDYVKSLGYKIARSSEQTPDGAKFWDKYKPGQRIWEQDIEENFADGKVKGKSRPGRVKRAGASCSGSVTDLRAKASKYGGEKGKMYHWCANMKAGRK
jgi:GNAT superfamily N-acetyltransferase